MSYQIFMYNRGWLDNIIPTPFPSLLTITSSIIPTHQSYHGVCILRRPYYRYHHFRLPTPSPLPHYHQQHLPSAETPYCKPEWPVLEQAERGEDQRESRPLAVKARVGRGGFLSSNMVGKLLFTSFPPPHSSVPRGQPKVFEK